MTRKRPGALHQTKAQGRYYCTEVFLLTNHFIEHFACIVIRNKLVARLKNSIHIMRHCLQRLKWWVSFIYQASYQLIFITEIQGWNETAGECSEVHKLFLMSIPDFQWCMEQWNRWGCCQIFEPPDVLDLSFRQSSSQHFLSQHFDSLRWWWGRCMLLLVLIHGRERGVFIGRGGGGVAVAQGWVGGITMCLFVHISA